MHEFSKHREVALNFVNVCKSVLFLFHQLANVVLKSVRKTHKQMFLSFGKLSIQYETLMSGSWDVTIKFRFRISFYIDQANGFLKSCFFCRSLLKVLMESNKSAMIKSDYVIFCCNYLAHANLL